MLCILPGLFLRVVLSFEWIFAKSLLNKWWRQKHILHVLFEKQLKWLSAVKIGDPLINQAKSRWDKSAVICWGVNAPAEMINNDIE